MRVEEKKAYLLLKAVIFYYHGLDEKERKLLNETAESIDGPNELKWAESFIARDYMTFFERARDYLKNAMNEIDRNKRIEFLWDVWKANDNKGYTTEMEASAMVRLARDWNVDRELRDKIRKEYKFL